MGAKENEIFVKQTCSINTEKPMIIDELDVQFLRKTYQWAGVQRRFSILTGILKDKN